jgi:uncharacterized ubiquitin-like protein YukD
MLEIEKPKQPSVPSHPNDGKIVQVEQRYQMVSSEDFLSDFQCTNSLFVNFFESPLVGIQ